MALSIYSLFKVNIANLVQNKARLAYSCRTQPSEVDRMPYWEYEEYMKAMQNIIEEENKRQEEAEKGKSSSRYNPNTYQHQARKSVPRMPSAPRMPNFNKIPRL